MADKTIRVILQAITGQYQAAMGQAAATTKGFGSVANTAGTRAGGLQTQIGNLSPKMLKFGAAVGAAGLALHDAVGDSIAWESAFAGVRKTVDASEAEFAELASGIRDMSTEIPTSANELAGVAEAAGQLGIETDNILGFTRVIADLGETTNLSGQEAATTLARLANITGMSQDKFENLGSSLVRLGNNFETTEAEVASFGLRIAAAGSLAGMTEGDILGIGAAFSSVGVPAERGGTAVNKVISSMIEAVATGSEDLQTFAETAGMTAEQFAESWRDNPGQAFASFVEGLGSAGTTAYGILDELGLKDERLVQSFLSVANAGDLMTESIKESNEANKVANDLSKEAQQRYDTLASKIDVLKNKWNEVSITIGDAVVPAVDKAVAALGFLADFAHPDTMAEVRKALFEGDVGPVSLDTVRQWLGLEEPLDEVANSAAGVSTELSAADQAAMDAAGSFLTLGEGLEDVADAGYEAAEGLAASADEALKVADPVFALFDAWRDYEEAQTAANEAIAEHGAVSHEAVQAGQDLAVALMELQAAAVDGDLDFATFEATLQRWVEQGRITAEQAHTIAHGVDHARESAEEFAGDYTATVTLRPEGFEYLDGLDARLAQITRDRTVSVNVRTAGSPSPSPTASSPSPSAGGSTARVSAGGSGGVARAQGGPMLPGHRYIVGEEGAEQVDMFSYGAMVTPLAGSSSTTVDNSKHFEGHVEQHFHGDTDPRVAGFRAGHELRGLELLGG